MQNTGASNKSALFSKLRSILLAGGIIALAAAAWFFPALRDSVACSVTTEVQFSPGGEYRAQKSDKVCAWGGWMGAANATELEVSMEGKQGWTRSLPLAEDGAPVPEASPAIKWKSANLLEVTLYSRDISGAITRRIHELGVTLRYTKPPKKN